MDRFKIYYVEVNPFPSYANCHLYTKLMAILKRTVHILVVSKWLETFLDIHKFFKIKIRQIGPAILELSPYIHTSQLFIFNII